MGSDKITAFDLGESVLEAIENVEEFASIHNIKSYNSLSQLNINIGEETIDDIMTALPDHSIMQLAVTSEYNSNIYPSEEGTIIIEDVYGTGATLRFYTKDDKGIVRIWKGFYGNNSWTGWSEIYTEETLTTEKLKEKGIVTDIDISTDINEGIRIGIIEINGVEYALYAPDALDMSKVEGLQEALESRDTENTEFHNKLQENIDNVSARIDTITEDAPENMDTFVEVAGVFSNHSHTISNVQGLQEALNSKEEAGAASKALSDANAYTDNKVAELVDSAPETLDTFAEVAEAFRNNEDVVQALNDAIGNRAEKEHTHKYAGSDSVGGAANTAIKLATARNIKLSGDVTGSTSFDGTTDITITATVNDNSHNHTIGNVDGLQDKLNTIPTKTETWKITFEDGTSVTKEVYIK